MVERAQSSNDIRSDEQEKVFEEKSATEYQPNQPEKESTDSEESPENIQPDEMALHPMREATPVPSQPLHRQESTTRRERQTISEPVDSQQPSSSTVSRNQIVEQQREPAGIENQSDAIQSSVSDSPSADRSPQVSSKRKRKKKIYQINPEKLAPLRDRSKLRPPQRYEGETNTVFIHSAQTVLIPQSYEEAMASEQKDLWSQAMTDEIQSMKDLNAYTLTKLPNGKKALSNRWVFALKKNPDGSIHKFKARLVLRGYTQRKGVDFNELYSPVCRFEVIRCILNIALREDLVCYQCDVRVAFLNAKIDNDIWMEQPKGFEVDEESVCHLNSAIYGTRQASRCWYKKMSSTLCELGLYQLESDACVFIGDENSRLILCLYVDDSIIVGRTEQIILDFLKRSQERFEITFRPLDHFLGMQIVRTETALYIHQENYAKEILERFGMTNCKVVATPLEREIYGEDDTEPADVEYRQLVGSMSFLVQVSRPDLCFSVNYLSRFLERPTKRLWTFAMRILRYLKGTLRFGIRYTKDGDRNYHHFSDSDFASDPLTRRSVSGTMILANGGAIYWQSLRQKSVSLSSAESELEALALSTQTTIFLNRLVTELGYKSVPTLMSDNQATIALVSDNQYHKRTKHIATKFFFCRELIDAGQLKVEFVPSESNCSDICTKPHTKATFQRLRTMIGVIEVPQLSSENLQHAKCISDSSSP